eukprot:jgi/Bigna1/42249/e_gw1.62.28.1
MIPRPNIHGKKSQGSFDLTYFLQGAFAGGICCSITHGALHPVDVVKTRIALNYRESMIAGFRQVIAEEGVSALTIGLGPTVVGYFLQGWFKFGGVEFFKINFAQQLGEARAWELRIPIYLGAAICTEFITDIFLCPLETTRIRLVSNPEYASGVISALPKILSEDGLIKGFYSGFGPILLKQIPYTMAKFTVQGVAVENICAATGVNTNTASERTKLAISLSSGAIAGVASAIISHPADTLLFLINKEGAVGEGTLITRLGRLAYETGFVKLCVTGLGARCAMIGSLTAGQFGIFDTIMSLAGTSKFKFTSENKN